MQFTNYCTNFKSFWLESTFIYTDSSTWPTSAKTPRRRFSVNILVIDSTYAGFFYDLHIVNLQVWNASFDFIIFVLQWVESGITISTDQLYHTNILWIYETIQKKSKAKKKRFVQIKIHQPSIFEILPHIAFIGCRWYWMVRI